MDRDQFAKEEAVLNKKMKELSLKNSELLTKQIQEHKAKIKGMDETEYMLNKGYLKGIRKQKHQILSEEKN